MSDPRRDSFLGKRLLKRDRDYFHIDMIARRAYTRCMVRISRVVCPGTPHHVTQCGVRRMNVFYARADRAVYLDLLEHYARQYGLRVWAYCLMTNHIHLVAVPQTEDSLSRALQQTHACYAQHLNARRRESGHLWQGRFFSCPLDDAHLWAAVRYVERNPVRAKMVRAPWRYEWSSAAAHCGLKKDGLLDTKFPSRDAVPDWRSWVGAPDEAGAISALRASTLTGRPCGTGLFVAKLERLLGRVLEARPRGRPRRKRGRKGRMG